MMLDLWINWWDLRQICIILNLCKIRILEEEQKGEIWGFLEIVGCNPPSSLRVLSYAYHLFIFKEALPRRILMRFASLLVFEHRMDASRSDEQREQAPSKRMPKTWNQAMEDPMFNKIYEEPQEELSELEKVTGYWHSIQANTPAWEEHFASNTNDYLSAEAHELEVAKRFKKGKKQVSYSHSKEVEAIYHIAMPQGYGWYSSPQNVRIEESTKSSDKGKRPLLYSSYNSKD